jgi:hypothetical protein
VVGATIACVTRSTKQFRGGTGTRRTVDLLGVDLCDASKSAHSFLRPNASKRPERVERTILAVISPDAGADNVPPFLRSVQSINTGERSPRFVATQIAGWLGLKRKIRLGTCFTPKNANGGAENRVVLLTRKHLRINGFSPGRSIAERWD